MNILPHERGQVYLFASGEFGLQGKRVGCDVEFQIPQARHTLHAHPDREPACGKKTAFAEAEIQRVGQRGNRNGSRFLQIETGGIFFSFEMERLPLWNLANMNFH